MVSLPTPEFPPAGDISKWIDKGIEEIERFWFTSHDNDTTCQVGNLIGGELGLGWVALVEEVEKFEKYGPHTRKDQREQERELCEGKETCVVF